MIYDLRNKFKLLTSDILSHSCVRGFTLIELLIVISLIGVLSSVLIVLINPVTQFKRARDAQRKADIRQIQSALEMYRSDVGNYPVTGSLPFGAVWTFNGVTYMSKVPSDPKNGWTVYSYTSAAPSTTYTLISCLENANDPQANGVACGTDGKQFTVNNP
jgi:type II secretion system protein G